MSTIAQRPEEIDLERAERDRQEAEAAMREETEEHQIRGCRSCCSAHWSA